MKHLFLVSVILFIGSGATLSAQTAVKPIKYVIPHSNTNKFIEAIEIKRETSPVVNSEIEDVWAIAPKKTTSVISSKKNIAENISIENCTTLQFKYALMIDADVEQITNLNLYNSINAWWATRYRYGGTTRNGIDCSALTSTLLKDGYGIVAPRTARAQYAASQRIERLELKEGDLVFFNTRGGISHVGMYLDNNYFVHSSSSKGVMISSLNESYYSSKYVGGGRLKNSEFENDNDEY